MNIGKLLRSYREVNRKSICDLSKEIGLTIATLSRIENGKPVDLRITLVLINWLFGGQKSKESPNTAPNSTNVESAMAAISALRDLYWACMRADAAGDLAATIDGSLLDRAKDVLKLHQ